MITYRESIAKVQLLIQELDKQYYQHIAHDLCASVINCDRNFLLGNLDSSLTTEQFDAIEKMIQRCCNGEPIEYIIGKIMFSECLIHVSPDVLIPRVETEILLEYGLSVLEQIEAPKIVDVATGSGCIAIAAKKRRGDASVLGADQCSAALAMAQRNGRENSVDIDWLQGDFLEPFRQQKVDAIFCNPPYISVEEYEKLDRSVKQFEPMKALVPPDNALYFYQKLAHEGHALLKDHGWLFLEIGKDRATEVKSLFQHHYKKTMSLKDWSGHDRFIFVQK